MEREIRAGAPLAPIRALANKLAQHAARLAAVLTLVDSIDRPDIPAEMLEYGIVLAEHYAAEALRMAQGGEMDTNLLLADEVLSWLRTDWTEPLIALPDVYQLGPPAVREAKTARSVLALLEEHGWLARIEGGAEVRGQRRRDVWRLVEVKTP
jgi:hypothetical protein